MIHKVLKALLSGIVYKRKLDPELTNYLLRT